MEGTQRRTAKDPGGSQPGSEAVLLHCLLQPLPALRVHQKPAQKLPALSDLLPSKPASAQLGEPNAPPAPSYVDHH